MNAHLNHDFNFVFRLHRIDAQILAVRKFTHKVTRYYYYDHPPFESPHLLDHYPSWPPKQATLSTKWDLDDLDERKQYHIYKLAKHFQTLNISP